VWPWPRRSPPSVSEGSGGSRGSGGRYLPALDGLRALAVGAVVSYHLGLPWARGGYLGVDLFFVLSGFLITGLLLHDTGFKRFYSRRARRLLPALFLLLAVVSVWVARGGTGVDRASFRGDVLAALAYVANWRFVFSHQGYFAQFTVPSPIRHVWSLAIEEQFYLLWPVVLLGLRRRGRSFTLAATVAMAGASAVAMALLYHPGVDPSRAYYGTDTRAFELLIGAVLALVTTGRAEPGPGARRWLHAAGAAALAGFLVLAVVVPDRAGWMYRGGFALAAVLAAVAVLSVGRRQAGPLGAALSIGPQRWVGRISYGIYLWHWPVIDLLTRSATGLSGNTLRLAQVAVTLGAASISYYALERPVRTGALRGWRVRVAAPVAVVGVVMVGLWASTVPVVAAVEAPATKPTPAAARSAAAGPTTTVPAPPVPPPLGLTGGRMVTAQDPLRVLVVGDSVMWDASLGIKAALEATGVARVDPQAVLGVGLTQTAYRWRTAWPRLVVADRPDVVVAMFGGWDGPQVVANGVPWYAGLVDQATAILTAGGARLVLMEYPRNLPPDIPGQPPVDQAANERQREAVDLAFAGAVLRHPGVVAYLPVGPVLDLGGQFTSFLPGPAGVPERVRKHDDVHFCPAGAERVGRWVLDALTGPYGLPAPDPSWATGPWRADPRYDLPHGACA